MSTAESELHKLPYPCISQANFSEGKRVAGRRVPISFCIQTIRCKDTLEGVRLLLDGDSVPVFLRIVISMGSDHLPSGSALKCLFKKRILVFFFNLLPPLFFCGTVLLTSWRKTRKILVPPN